MRAVFLDLNGTLVMPVRVTHPGQYTLIPGAAEAVRLLNQYGFVCPIITVQSRVSKNIFTLDDFMQWFRAFQTELCQQDATILGPYLCPHRGRDACHCKKPQSYLYQQAAAEHDIDLAQSAGVGDTLDDVHAARALGIASCLVRTGWGEQAIRERDAGSVAAYVAVDVLDAAQWIIANQGKAGL